MASDLQFCTPEAAPGVPQLAAGSRLRPHVWGRWGTPRARGRRRPRTPIARLAFEAAEAVEGAIRI
jgi:hypothetical protein